MTNKLNKTSNIYYFIICILYTCIWICAIYQYTFNCIGIQKWYQIYLHMDTLTHTYTHLHTLSLTHTLTHIYNILYYIQTTQAYIYIYIVFLTFSHRPTSGTVGTWIAVDGAWPQSQWWPGMIVNEILRPVQPNVLREALMCAAFLQLGWERWCLW